MRILLVIPPGSSETKYRSGFLNFTSPPLGLAYIAAVLEENGYTKVRIFDSKALEATFEDFREVLKRTRPDILGIQALTPEIYDALKTIRIAKEQKVPQIALGGYHASSMPEECLELSNGALDLVFRGEAEYSFLETVGRIEEGKDWKDVKGVSYHENGKIIHNPDAPLIKDLDELPFPSRHLLPLDKYRIFGSSFPATTMITSRGCPYACDFCSVSHFYNRTWRKRSPENIAEEMQIIRDQGNLAIAFVDDLFFVSEKRVRKICREIIKLKIDIYWGATTRADKGSLESLSLMRKAGCRMVFAGIESGSQEILNNIHKRTTLGQVETFFENIKKARMDSIGSVSFGFPGETKKSVLKTINWVVEVLDPSLAIFTISTPYPGTDFFKDAKKKGILAESDYSKFSLFYPILETTGLTREELKRLTKFAYKKFYLRPRKVWENTTRELRYSLESYGLRQFFNNGLVFLKGIVGLHGLLS